MNSDTGQLYHGLAAIESARRRGEPIVDLTPDFSDATPETENRPISRQQRRAQERFAFKQSRKANHVYAK